jgi:hypothetical protein
MCQACGPDNFEDKWRMIEIIADGKLPDGHSVADLRAMGMPVPGELYRQTRWDGSTEIRQRSPAEIAALKLKNFGCDSPQ